MTNILVVDENLRVRESVRVILGASATVRTATLSDDVLTLLAREPADILILGLSVPLARPLRMLGNVLLADPNVRVLLLAERALLTTAQRLFNYRIETILPKPFDTHELRSRVRDILASHDNLPTLLEEMERGDRDSPAIQADLSILLPRDLHPIFERLAANTGHIVIEGERGTGKSALALRIHAEGPWHATPYARVDARSLTEPLLVSTLRELAEDGLGQDEHGTLCIEEIRHLSPALQSVLRDLAEGTFPNGTPERARRMALRLITTTSESLLDLAADGTLQEDLREALSVLVLKLPPLREREAELEFILKGIAGDWARRFDREEVRFSQAALDRLNSYLWPGNLRELRAVLGRALALTEGGEVPGEAIVLFGEQNRPSEAAPDAPVNEDKSEAMKETLAPFPASEKATSAAPKAPSALELVSHLLSHEVKNPLVAIKTFTQLLKEKFDDSDFRNQFYEIVRSDVERIDSLVEAASAFSRFGTPHVRAVEVAGLIELILKDFERIFLSKRIVVLRERPDDLPLARADREQLTYALRCLLAKALDLVPEGADLHLESRVAGSEDGGGQRLKCILRFRTPDGVFGLIPEIGEDHGAPDAQPASLEIALAREILSRQGGDLCISTTDGRETVFTVVLQTV